jgi:hypothetical protein
MAAKQKTASPQEDFERVGADLADKGVWISMVFGKPAYKDENGHSFACMFGDGLSCRLIDGTPEFTEALALPGAEPFDPSGGRRKPMSGWVVVPHQHADKWLHFAQAAFNRPPRKVD